jgi:putative membrane protein
MIVDRQLSFQSVTVSIRKENLIFFAISLLITLFYRRLNITELSLAVTPLTILGAAITIFLGFRTNTAYDRWWEARGLWGALINHSRSLVRQAMTFTDPPSPKTEDEFGEGHVTIHPFARRMAFLQIAFVNALRTHLRKQDALGAAAQYLSPQDVKRLDGIENVPLAVLRIMGIELRNAHQQGWLDSIQMSTMDGTLVEFSNILGGCEKIKNTPLPRQYDTVPQFAIYAYSILLPLGLVESLGWWTPFISAMITFLFIAIDSIGSNIEDPFENRIHDVPMSTISRTIEINLRQMVDIKECPAPLQPTHGILM